jgi:hypothetical protein
MLDLLKVNKNVTSYVLTRLIEKADANKLCKKYKLKIDKGGVYTTIAKYFYSDRFFQRKIISFLDSRFLVKEQKVCDLQVGSSDTEIWCFLRNNHKEEVEQFDFNSWLIKIYEENNTVAVNSKSNIASFERKISQITNKYNGLKDAYKELKKVCKSLKNQQTILTPKSKMFEDQKHECSEMLELRTQKSKLQTVLYNKQSIIDRQKEEIAQLKRELFKQTQATIKVHVPLETTVNCANCEAECEDCPHNVLLVGGPERMEESYRRVVKKLGGKFEYHAGHHKGEVNNLERLISWADIVLCPVNINSHFACKTVKSLCKKKNKRYRMLNSCGISSVANELKKFTQETVC